MEKNFAKINFIGFVTNAAIFFVIFFMPIYLKQSGFNGFEIGFLMAIFSITAIFTYFAIGVVNDILTVKGVLILSLFLLAVFLLGVSTNVSFFALVLLFLVGSMGKDFIRRSLENVVLKITGNETGKKLGTFIFFLTMGTVAGLLTVSFIAGFLDFKSSFLILAGLMLLMILPVITLEKIPVFRSRLLEYKEDVFNKKTLLFSVLLFIFGLHWGAEHTSYSLYLQEGLGLGLFNIGIYMAIPIAFYAITGLYFGRKIDDAWSYKKLFIIGIFISGIGHFFMVNSDVLISFLFRVFHEIGDGLFEVTKMVWVSLLFSRERIGGSFGVVMTISMLGAFTGSLIFGPMGEALGYGVPLQISGIIITAEAVLIAAYFTFSRRKH